MGAGFLIIHRAIKSAAEKIREEEAVYKKKVADGYSNELVMTNKSSCYVHYYRSHQKQQRGVIFACTSVLGLSIIIPALIIFPFTIWFLIPMITIFIFLLIGLSKIFNSERGWSDSKEPIKREGCFCFKTEYDPQYRYEWIKKANK